MIQLLLGLVLAEMALIVVFIFQSPSRKLVTMALDRVKRGQGPIVLKTFAGVIFLVMMATVYYALALRRRLIRDGEASATDQILMANYWLQIFLLGTSLFLGLTIDRLHYCFRELSVRRKHSLAAASEDIKALEQERTKLQEKIMKLQTQLQNRDNETNLLKSQLLKASEEALQLTIQLEQKNKEASSAEANALALRKQSEGFLLEYDRLLEENQILRRKLFSENKKDM